MSDRVTKELIDIFKPDGIDWLGDIISEDNPITYHHIAKACNGGRKTLDNGALLTKHSHKFIHQVLEAKDEDTYIELNREFKELNKTKQPPDNEYYFRVHDILSNKSKYDDVDTKVVKSLVRRINK